MTEAYANDSSTIRFYYDANAHFPVRQVSNSNCPLCLG